MWLPAGPTLGARAEWLASWLSEVEQLIRSNRVRLAEHAMLTVVRDELRGLAEKARSQSPALLLFVAVVSLADQVNRAQQPGLPPYPFAMSGLERLLNTDASTPWGELPNMPNSEPPQSWQVRFGTW